MPDKKKKGELPDRPVLREELQSPYQHDLSKKRDAQCIPIAIELIKEFGKLENIPLGSHVNEKEGALSAYLPVIRRAMTLLVEKEVKAMDVTYIFSLMRQAIEVVGEAVDQTLNQNMNNVTEMIYGLNPGESHNVTVKHLNDVIMKMPKIKEAIEKAKEE